MNLRAFFDNIRLLQQEVDTIMARHQKQCLNGPNCDQPWCPEHHVSDLWEGENYATKER